jgi:hypothetical protein
MGSKGTFYFVHSLHKLQKWESISDYVWRVCIFHAENRWKNFVKSNMNTVPVETVPI